MSQDEAKPSAELGTVVVTADGSLTLSHPEHGECYHTKAGAMAEARLLYAEASGLAEQWQHGRTSVSVLDVGLGLGLNAIATLTAWWEAAAPGDLALTSLEIDRALVLALAAATAPWQRNWEQTQLNFCLALQPTAIDRWTGILAHPDGKSQASWRVHLGDASTEELPASPLSPGYTHVWQDPFSPEKNPAMWSEAWFTRLRPLAGPTCVLMTYSVAGPVRRALQAGGWSWQKIPARLPGKRDWLKARPAGF